MTQHTGEVAANVDDLEARLGYWVKDRDLLRAAVTHYSICRAKSGNYDLLEIVGDRALSYALITLLRETYPSAAEGDLTKMISRLVSNENLSLMAHRLKLIPFIRHSSKHVLSVKMIADCVEAIFGVIDKEEGIETVMRVCRRLFQMDIVLSQFDHSPEQLFTEANEGRVFTRVYVVNKSKHPYFSVVLRGPKRKVIAVGLGATVDGALRRAASLALLSPHGLHSHPKQKRLKSAPTDLPLTVKEWMFKKLPRPREEQREEQVVPVV